MIEQACTQGQPAQLDAQQPARNVLVEAGKLPGDRKSIRLAEKHPSERAGVYAPVALPVQSVEGLQRELSPIESSRETVEAVVGIYRDSTPSVRGKSDG